MMSRTFLVFGATGGTGRHFVAKALSDGHSVRALVRSPEKLSTNISTSIQVVKGSITDDNVNVNELTKGVDYVVVMLGDRIAQQKNQINTAFIRRLVSAMRESGVKRILYQAGGLSRPYGGSLSTLLWILRHTIARSFNGQHQDNEAVMKYFCVEANDLEWLVHRAGIYGDGPSKGTLQSSDTKFSIASFIDCADYNYRTVQDDMAAIDRTNYSLGRYDLTSFFASPGALKSFTQDFISHFPSPVDAVIGIDALGFPLAAAVGYEMDIPVILARKVGKIPLPVEDLLRTEQFGDYSKDRLGWKGLEIRKSLLKRGMRVFVLDEWIDTGAQMSNLCQSLEDYGVTIAGIGTLQLREGKREGADALWEKYGVDGRLFAANRSPIVEKSL